MAEVVHQRWRGGVLTSLNLSQKAQESNLIEVRGIHRRPGYIPQEYDLGLFSKWLGGPGGLQASACPQIQNITTQKRPNEHISNSENEEALDQATCSDTFRVAGICMNPQESNTTRHMFVCFCRGRPCTSANPRRRVVVLLLVGGGGGGGGMFWSTGVHGTIFS